MEHYDTPLLNGGDLIPNLIYTYTLGVYDKRLLFESYSSTILVSHYDNSFNSKHLENSFKTRRSLDSRVASEFEKHLSKFHMCMSHKSPRGQDIG